MHLSKTCTFSSFELDVKNQPSNPRVLALSAFRDPRIFCIKNTARVFHGEPSAPSCGFAEGKVSNLQLSTPLSLKEPKHRADNGQSKQCRRGGRAPDGTGGPPHAARACGLRMPSPAVPGAGCAVPSGRPHCDRRH